MAGPGFKPSSNTDVSIDIRLQSFSGYVVRTGRYLAGRGHSEPGFKARLTRSLEMLPAHGHMTFAIYSSGWRLKDNRVDNTSIQGE